MDNKLKEILEKHELKNFWETLDFLITISGYNVFEAFDIAFNHSSGIFDLVIGCEIEGDSIIRVYELKNNVSDKMKKMLLSFNRGQFKEIPSKYCSAFTIKIDNTGIVNYLQSEYHDKFGETMKRTIKIDVGDPFRDPMTVQQVERLLREREAMFNPRVGMQLPNFPSDEFIRGLR